MSRLIEETRSRFPKVENKVPPLRNYFIRHTYKTLINHHSNLRLFYYFVGLALYIFFFEMLYMLDIKTNIMSIMYLFWNLKSRLSLIYKVKHIYIDEALISSHLHTYVRMKLGWTMEDGIPLDPLACQIFKFTIPDLFHQQLDPGKPELSDRIYTNCPAQQLELIH